MDGFTSSQMLLPRNDAEQAQNLMDGDTLLAGDGVMWFAATPRAAGASCWLLLH